MNISHYSNDLYIKNGIWYSNKNDEISYPDNGNEIFNEIEENSFWFKHRNKCIQSVIEHFSPKEIFFDIGGGNGFLAKFLQNFGHEIVLLEPGERGAINAYTRGLQNVICSSFSNACIYDNCLPAVGLFDVLEHIPDHEHFISLIHNKMVPSGKLYLTVPSYNWLWSREDQLSGHYRRYTISSLNKIISRSGFKILYSSYIFSPLPFAIFIFRTLPSKFKKTNVQLILKQFKSEHQSSNKLLNYFWNLEYRLIRKQKKIIFGGSCLMVAQKK